MPQVAPIADSILQTAGYTPPNPVGVDPNIAYPEQAIPPKVDFPSNADPLSPTSPFEGQEQGIETPEPDGVLQ